MPRKPLIITHEYPYHIVARSNNKEWFCLPFPCRCLQIHDSCKILQLASKTWSIMTMKFVEPEQYQNIANKVFDELSAKVKILIPQSRIEHIGSSSVPGIISKGDLDIFVGVQKNIFDSTIKLIESLNFSIKKDTLRTESLCMLESDQYSIDVAIQLVELGSKFENFLIFRDSLLKNENLRTEYNQLKRDAKKLDTNEYREIKSQFIQKVLASKN